MKISREGISRFCDTAVAVCLCSLIFFLPISKTMVEASVITAFVMWALAKTTSGNLCFRRSSVGLPLLIFLVVAAGSIAISAYPSISLPTFFRKTLKYGALVFLIIETVRTKKRVQALIICMMVSAGMVALSSFFQLAFNRFNFIPRVDGPFSNPNSLAGYVIVILPICIALTMKGKCGKRAIIALVMLAAGLAIALGASMSRGAWVAFLGTIIVMSFFLGKRAFIVLIATTLTVFLIMPLSVRERALSIVSLSDGGITDRRIIWETTAKIIALNPLTGQGVGTFMASFSQYKPPSYKYIVYAHNCYLQIVAEIGVFGLAAFLWMVGALYLSSIRRLKTLTDAFLRSVLFGSLGGITAYLVQASFDTNLYAMQLSFLFWFMVGFTEAIRQIDT